MSGEQKDFKATLPKTEKDILASIVSGLDNGEEKKPEEVPAVVKDDLEKHPDILDENAKPEAKEKAKKEKAEKGKKDEKPKAEVAIVPEEEELDEEAKGLVSIYEQEDPTPSKTAPAEEKEKKEKDPKNTPPSQEKLELERLKSDPFFKAVMEWRANGGNNPKELIDQLGLSAKEKTIEQYFREDAEAAGLTGDKLEAAVASELEDFEDLNDFRKAKILKEYQKSDSQKLDAKFEQYVANKSKEKESVMRIQTEATKSLKKKVLEQTGKKFLGLLIEEPMVEQILQDAPAESNEIYDEEGNLIGYDVDAGIEKAIWKNFGKRIAKTAYNLGRTAEAKKFAQARNRPNPDSNAGEVPKSVSTEEEETLQLSNLFKQVGSGKKP